MEYQRNETHAQIEIYALVFKSKYYIRITKNGQQLPKIKKFFRIRSSPN